MKTYIETPRLILRDWCDKDIAFFAGMNRDSKVMEFFPKKLTKEESIQFYNRIIEEIRTEGFGLYALELKSDNKFIGYTGFHRIGFEADFTPGIEIGWRLMYEFWGKGYAPEAAKACLKHAEQLGFKKVYSFTSIINKRSESVMQKIGMQKTRHFGHPFLDPGHPLYIHALYEINI